MIQVKADGVLAYDSRQEEYDLIGLTATNGLNVGGTAEITMPLGHPAYDAFIGHKTVVTIYRDGKLRFRGRALYAEDDFYRQRTVICEGELCFLRDAINRSYNYNSTPAKIFRALVRIYNEQMAYSSQADPAKQFTIGTVSEELEAEAKSVTFKSENPETVLDTLNKLLEMAGGYIVFEDAADGSRSINYYASLSKQSGQVIEFGENLLDFSISGENTTALATGLIPYGVKDKETKQRLTIASVNGGKDYILAEDAVTIRGTIMASVTFDDVTDPSVLLSRAWEYLNDAKAFITSLELNALDLSYIDKTVDTFAVGDQIRVRSAPHGVDEIFQLAQMTEDFLDPSRSRISMGKDIKSLTGAAVSTYNRTQNNLVSTRSELEGSYKEDIQKVEQSMAAQISASEKAAAEKYAAKGDLTTTKQEVLTAVANGYASKSALAQEITDRSALVKKSGGHVYVGGAGQNTYVQGSSVHIGDGDHGTFIYGKDGITLEGLLYFQGHSADFDTDAGVRFFDPTEGRFYYALRVDSNLNCFVGNDYVNLYLRAKDNVYLHKTGAVVTSDRKEKNNIEELPEAYAALLDKIKPVRFRYNGKGDTYHVGFVAQDVEGALESSGLSREDFGGLVDVNGTKALAYDEFVGLLLQKMRQLEKRINDLEGRIES